MERKEANKRLRNDETRPSPVIVAFLFSLLSLMHYVVQGRPRERVMHADSSKPKKEINRDP